MCRLSALRRAQSSIYASVLTTFTFRTASPFNLITYWHYGAGRLDYNIESWILHISYPLPKPSVRQPCPLLFAVSCYQKAIRFRTSIGNLISWILALIDYDFRPIELQYTSWVFSWIQLDKSHSEVWCYKAGVGLKIIFVLKEQTILSTFSYAARCCFFPESQHGCTLPSPVELLYLSGQFNWCCHGARVLHALGSWGTVAQHCWKCMRNVQRKRNVTLGYPCQKVESFVRIFLGLLNTQTLTRCWDFEQNQLITRPPDMNSCCLWKASKWILWPGCLFNKCPSP